MSRAALAVAPIAVIAVVAPVHADADDPSTMTSIFAEVDPLPFALGGYGTQIGVRHPALRGVRLAVASFSLDVPDAVAELGGNDGFEIRVRPSAATYLLYYFAPPLENGFAVGGSLRYLRLRYRHADEPGTEADVSELSPEAIAGYQWHPFGNGFYVQPWLGLSFTLWKDGERTVGTHTYDAMPIQPFFTVNIGFEYAL
jgi:hypothetical protein